MSPNSFTSSSDPGPGARRLLAGFLCGCGLLLLPGIYLAHAFQSGDGDLTRIAHLPARDFAPAIVQPDLPILGSVDPAAADVVVLGDSFSADNDWQSAFTARTGLQVATWRIREDACVDLWLRQALRRAFSAKARVVVVETVERAFLERFVRPESDCADTRFLPVSMQSHVASGRTQPSPLFPIDIRHVAKTVTHALSPQLHAGRYDLRKAVLVDLTRPGLFSNALAQRMVYLKADEVTADAWSSEAVASALARFAVYKREAAAVGLDLRLLVVPDKSTVYAPWVAPGQLPPMPESQLFPMLAHVLGPDADLLPEFRAAAAQRPDFYNPDNTHLSLQGYRHLADMLIRRLGLPSSR